LIGLCRRKGRRNETGGDEVFLDIVRRCLLHDLKAQIRYLTILVEERRQAIVGLAFDGVHERKGEAGARPATIARLRPDPPGLHDDVPVTAPLRTGTEPDHVLSKGNEIAFVGEEGNGDAREQLRVPTEDRRRRQYRGLSGHLCLAQSQRPKKRRVLPDGIRPGSKRSIADYSTRPRGRKQLGRANSLSRCSGVMDGHDHQRP